MEYIFHQLGLFCEEAWIEHQLTADTPEQNWVSKEKKQIYHGSGKMYVARKEFAKDVLDRGSKYSCVSTKSTSLKNCER